MNSLSRLLLCCFLLQVFTRCLAKDTVFPEQLTLSNIKWPPYLFPYGDGPLGIAKDVLYACMEGQTTQITYLDLPVKRTEFYMRSGQLDLSLYSYKSSREDFLVYGKEPVFISEYGFAVSADRDISVNNLSGLNDLIIGHLAGLTYTPDLLQIVNQKREKGEIVEAYDIDLQLQQLISKPARVDIVPNSKQTFYWRAKELGISDKIKVLDFTIAKKPYFFTVSKASQNVADVDGFLAKLDECIIELREDGRYRQILSQYGQL